MKQLKKGTWVLIADGKKALFLRNDLDTQDYDLRVVRLAQQDNPPTGEQGSDRAGRRSDGVSGHSSGMEETDWHQLAEDRFAHEIADILWQRAQKGAFEQIVLVAPPGVLGEMRKVMHGDLAARVLAEIPKTLTNHPIDKIQKLLKVELDKL